ncbi:MAG: hypothetical protein M3R03_02765 [Pseudomonadota bacterium]|nr:hypothetical protein [Pseudomonadota bacterium]
MREQILYAAAQPGWPEKISETVLNRQRFAAFPHKSFNPKRIKLMPTLAIAILLSQLPPSPDVSRLPLFVATSAERDSGFSNLAECEKVLFGPDGVPGTRFNRAAGNTSRCELVSGEAVVVVYPKGLGKAPPRQEQ